METLHYPGLIRAAGVEVLNRLMPPYHHMRRNCPEIDDSELDLRQKAMLYDLRNELLVLAHDGAANDIAQGIGKCEFLVFLGDVVAVVDAWGSGDSQVVDQLLTPRPSPERPTIWYHGGQSYSTDGYNPLNV